MPIKYIPYTPDPVGGQALLNNIPRSQRLLRYRDNDKVFERILRGLPYYELETVEQVGGVNPGWNNLLLRGECLSACAYLKKQGIEVDLVYIDPPFASGANYAKTVYVRRNPLLREKVTQVEEKLEVEDLKTFEETVYGDIWQKEDYLNWMYENLMAIKAVMSDTASIYVHLDWHIGHYVKILMDEVFGEENFINELVWYYKDASGVLKKGFRKKHDNIFIYVKSDEFYFNADAVRQEYGASTKKAAEAGTISFGRPTSLHPAGKYPDDVLEISIINSQSKERMDYATQKPEALLQRIIKASSDEGGVVADFFGGSGVTAKVAHDLNRRFIHCDVGVNSLQITRDRLQAAKADFQVMDIKDGVSLFRNPQQTMDKLATLIPGLQQQVEGIGDFWLGVICDSKLGRIPVYVPDLINSSEKTLDVPVVNRIINQELQKLDVLPEKAIAYFVDIDDRGELEQFIRENNPTLTEIELRDLKQVLDHVVDNDEFSVSVSREQDEFVTRVIGFHSDRLQQKLNEYNDKRRLNTANSDNIQPVLSSEAGLELIEWLAVDCNHVSGVWRSSHEIKIDKLGYSIVDGSKTGQFWDGAIRSKQRPRRIKIRNIAGDETIKTVE